MRATGLSDGKYEFGGQGITVINGTARTSDGALAGSTSTLFDCVKCAIDFGIPEAKSYEEMSRRAAELIREQIDEKTNSVLGLATGAPPSAHMVVLLRCIIIMRLILRM